ncbi:MAG: Ig-like domain-containing protein, partial [Nitrospirota bacterium]|nr:Ig-like domain-containing protein [Nitrospirota bacterium]
MKTKKPYIVSCLVAFLVLIGGLTASPASAATLQVRSGMAAPGAVITLPVEITGDVQDIYGYQLDVTAVPSSGAPGLTLGAIANGSIVTTSALVESHPAVPTTQPVRIGLSTVIPAPGDPRPVFDGPGAMAQLTFNVPVTAVMGQSYLINVSGVLLAGPGNQAIGVSAFGGMITVGAFTALADTISAPLSFTVAEGVSEPLTVTVTGFGQLIPGVTVHFSVDNAALASLSAATAVSDGSGTASINVTGIRDGGTIIRVSAPGITEVTVPLTVLGVTPYITSLPPLEVNKGGTYIYDAQATDPNGDALTYALVLAP